MTNQASDQVKNPAKDQVNDHKTSSNQSVVLPSMPYLHGLFTWLIYMADSRRLRLTKLKVGGATLSGSVYFVSALPVCPGGALF